MTALVRGEPGASAAGAGGGKSKIFISYSRADAQFVDDLVAGLEEDGAFEILIDRAGIGEGEDWQARLRDMILACDTMVFVLSPESVGSKICQWEVSEAQAQGRRILPVLWRVVDFAAAPPGLSQLNAVRFTEHQVIRGLKLLIAALKTDLGWLREHSALTERAAQWADKGRPAELTLRGAVLAEARALLARRPEQAPATPATTNAFLEASTAEEQRQQDDQARQIEALEKANAIAKTAQARLRRRLAAAVLALVVAIGAGAFAVVSRQEAVEAQKRAEENFTIAEQAINSLIFDIAQDLKNTQGVSPAAIRRILGQAETALDQLRATQPGNARLQRMKGVALNEFGDVYLRTGQAAEAATAFDAALRISRSLAAAEPENTGYQRDVSVSLDRLGDLRLRRGEAEAALAAYEEGLAIRRSLAAAEPENVQAQTDLVVSLYKLSQIWEGAEKIAALREAVERIEALAAAGVLSADQAEWPAIVKAALAEAMAE